MRCPRCQTEKAYLRDLPTWAVFLSAMCFVLPMRCHHCFHRFLTPLFRAIGNEIAAPETVDRGALWELRAANSDARTRDPAMDEKRDAA